VREAFISYCGSGPGILSLAYFVIFSLKRYKKKAYKRNHVSKKKKCGGIYMIERFQTQVLRARVEIYA
jgi:hypothetical protein